MPTSLRLASVLLILLTVGIATSFAQPEFATIAIESPEEFLALVGDRAAEIDILDLSDHRCIALLTEDQIRWIQNLGFTVTARPLPAPTPDAVDGYLTFDEYVADMQSWVATHPSIASLESIGQSWEGRDIWLLKISDNVAVNEDEPEVLLIGLQHAREWLGGMTLHGILDHLLTEYGTDPEVTILIDSMEIFAVLVANPDGYVYSHTTQRSWRPNRNPLGGVDLNRNWPFQWGGGAGGIAPLSEPETQALNDWLLSRSGEIVGCLNYHTYGTRVMHGWAYTYDLPPNTDLMGPLARDVAFSIESVHGQRFRNGSWSISLSYTGGGATNDHLQAAFGIPTLTFELRPISDDSQAFYVPGSFIQPSVEENIPGAITFLQWALEQGTDLTPPVISNEEVSLISNTQATFTWTTDDASTRFVEYGVSAAYGSILRPDKLRDTTHSVTVTGLAPNTPYHSRVVSENLAGMTTFSGDITFMTTATAQDITAPSAPAIDWVRVVSPGSAEITWIPLDGGALQGHRLYESEDGETWSVLFDEHTLTSGMTSHTFSAPPNGSPRLYRLTNVDTAPLHNESLPSDTYGLMTWGSAANALIVDGYDRWNSMHISQGENHVFAGTHALAVAAYGTPFDTCRNEMVGEGMELTDYDIVIWVLGDESTTTSTLTTPEQSFVEAFLEDGGNLFVSGSNIAYDLDLQGSIADQVFFHSYLCADYSSDNLINWDMVGTGSSSIFGTAEVRFDEGSRGIYRVWDPDGITPLNGAISCLETPTLEGVSGIQREGLFGGGSPRGGSSISHSHSRRSFPHHRAKP